jgi:hypothetical protein
MFDVVYFVYLSRHEKNNKTNEVADMETNTNVVGDFEKRTFDMQEFVWPGELIITIRQISRRY